jgi:hypothetical protein
MASCETQSLDEIIAGGSRGKVDAVSIQMRIKQDLKIVVGNLFALPSAITNCS